MSNENDQGKDPMSPEKIRQHEPTAVKRDSSGQTITDKDKVATDAEQARETARRSGMAKGTAGAGEVGDEYEQGAAGTNR